jgi:hypothetical protein
MFFSDSVWADHDLVDPMNPAEPVFTSAITS